MTFRERQVRGLPKKFLSLLLISGMVLTPLPSFAWGTQDDDLFNNRLSYNASNQQTAQNSYKPPVIEVKPPVINVLQAPQGRLDTEGRGIVQALNALTIAKTPIVTPAPSIKVEQAVIKPLTLQFKPVAAVQTPKLELGQGQALSTAKPGFLGGVQKALAVVGKAFAGAGQKIAAVIKAVVQVFRGKPGGDPSALAQKVGKEFSNLNEIAPGRFQTQVGAQTFVHGKSWEGGSTFQATPQGIKLIQGTTFESTLEGLSRADGKTLPIKMRGTPDGIEATGLDFKRMAVGTVMKSETPVELPKVGSFQADQMTYTGEKNGDPILELQGKGALSVESITDPKVLKQAERQLSLRLHLQNDSFEVKDAVLTVGGEKTYLDGQGHATSVKEIETSVQTAAAMTTPLVAKAGELDAKAAQYQKAVDTRLDFVLEQSGQESPFNLLERRGGVERGNTSPGRGG